MRRYLLQSAFLPQGWAQRVVVDVSADGYIAAVESTGAGGGPPDHHGLERIDGLVVPGMANAHSHAFQRAMAGNTEFRLSARDSFWTWRRAMYALANRIEPDDLQILATQLFVEMLRGGYTSVAEFHYLHRQLDGCAYQGRNALWEAIGNAATTAGIGLTFMPTLYQTSDLRRPAVEARTGAFRLGHRYFPARAGRADRHGPRQPLADAAHRRGVS